MVLKINDSLTLTIISWVVVLGTHQPLGGEVGDQILGGSTVDAVSLRKHVQLKQNRPLNQEDATLLVFAILYLHIISREIYTVQALGIQYKHYKCVTVYAGRDHCFTVQ